MIINQNSGQNLDEALNKYTDFGPNSSIPRHSKHRSPVYEAIEEEFEFPYGSLDASREFRRQFRLDGRLEQRSRLLNNVSARFKDLPRNSKPDCLVLCGPLSLEYLLTPSQFC